MASIREAERRRLDPLSLPDPRAFSRWRDAAMTRELQKVEVGAHFN